MRIGFFHLNFMAHNDAIKPRHSPVAVKAGRSFDETVVMESEFGQCTPIRPLVEIAHQHGRQMMLCAIEPGQKRTDLPPAP